MRTKFARNYNSLINIAHQITCFYRTLFNKSSRAAVFYKWLLYVLTAPHKYLSFTRFFISNQTGKDLTLKMV